MEIHLWGVPVQLVHTGRSNISSRHSETCLLKSRAVEKGGKLQASKEMPLG